MSLSIFDLFKVGIGPSSSHTVGPMWAANRFLLAMESRGLIEKVARIEVGLYGSLALTGKGHSTDTAVLLGLVGECPDKVEPDAVPEIVGAIRSSGRLQLYGRQDIAFTEAEHLQFHFLESLPKHPNGMEFKAWDCKGDSLLEGLLFGGWRFCPERRRNGTGTRRVRGQRRPAP